MVDSPSKTSVLKIENERIKGGILRWDLIVVILSWVFQYILSLECMKNFQNHLLVNIWSYFCSYTLMRFKLRISTSFPLHRHTIIWSCEKFPTHLLTNHSKGLWFDCGAVIGWKMRRTVLLYNCTIVQLKESRCTRL